MNILILLGISIINAQRKSYILKRDKEFIGPDKRLEQLLQQRMTPPSFVAAELRALESPPRPKPTPTPAPLARRANTLPQFQEYNAEHLKPKILQLQQQLVQVSKVYIDNLENNVIVKHINAMDERARVANIFGKLQQWLKKMRTLYESTMDARYRKLSMDGPHTREVTIHFYYYQHMLRSHIDITYTVEFLIHIHQRFSKIKFTRKNRSSTVDEDDVDDVDDVEKSPLELLGKEEQELVAQVYDKLGDKQLTADQTKYLIMMHEAGLTPTLPP